ncbi:MAG: vanadium-dependent haloperoxidase [Verrucomicrobia bacterium]|nr:vanadium-dependent haloperoxidase [Verrucomicrobiota bacterium]
MKILRLVLFLTFSLSVISQAHATNSVARVWDERALAAIRADTPHPPAQARNLFSLSVCMYDAWAAYDSVAVGYVYHAKHAATNLLAARNEAISYAAYRMLKERHFYSKTFSNTLYLDDAQMTALGYDTNNVSRDTSTPAGVGNSVYDAVSAWFINDGARQTNGTRTAPYPDYPTNQGGYIYINPPLATSLPGIDDGSEGTNGPGHTVVDINRWQRLQVVNGVDQNGFPTGPIQTYLGAQWLGVRPFALTRTDPTLSWIDLAGPPPHLGGVGDAEFRNSVVEMIRKSSQLTPDDGVMVDISPTAFGNNTLGANDGTGHPINPYTGQPYPSNLVKRGDFARVLAEFWADGPSSETPPGHWNVIANNVSDNTNFVKRLGGTGPVLNDLEWDVKLYFALNAAVHDAACAAWSLKRYYDGWRPISAVRYMALQGQSSDPSSPSYNPNGLPLIPELIELVTSNTVASGRHAGLTVGKIAVYNWPGGPTNPVTQHSGVKWIHGESWVPYQKATFVTPAFPGYISGHSTFSRSAAEVLAAITGTPYFPGGLFVADIAVANTSTGLAFENGPSQPVQLQCATYYDAADQAGISRIFGGIHPPADDFPGRRTGAQCGKGVWALAQKYFDGSIAQVPFALTIRPLDPTGCELRFDTVRGFFYKLQSTSDLLQSFADDPAGFVQAYDTSMVRTDNVANSAKLYRVLRASAP